MAKVNKHEALKRRHVRLRRRLSGTAEAPRMSVCFTSRGIYVQFIDDLAGQTLAAVSTLDKTFRESGQKATVAGATVLGKLAAERALAKQISRVVFDRGGFRYHGRVKAIADAARAGGLKF